ncbi:SCO4225 family membrane protein [Streptomyces sp. NPDC051636]|uniref:SCO4225 family membrane protein n=1 Tax=Streptomyces sp. NPDC051636 TaxID=3365663 RepID=UPI0037972D9D
MDSCTTARSDGIRTAVARNRLSWLYLAVTAAVLTWAVTDQASLTHTDATFSAVWPLLLTAPTSWLLLVLPAESLAVYTGVVTLAAVANAWFIAKLIRTARGSDQE